MAGAELSIIGAVWLLKSYPSSICCNLTGDTLQPLGSNGKIITHTCSYYFKFDLTAVDIVRTSYFAEEQQAEQWET